MSTDKVVISLRGILAPGASMGDQDLKAELEKLNAENVALKQRGPASINVSEKGAVSVYGLLGRFPVTLYKEQWEKLLSMATTTPLEFVKLVWGDDQITGRQVIPAVYGRMVYRLG